MLTGRDPYHGWNAGFLALCANFAITAFVTVLTPIPSTFRPTVPHQRPPRRP
jgi:hypothetical protein